MEHHSRDEYVDAAVEAELRTGERESSESKAKAHIMVRLVRMTFGFIVVIIGIIMLPLPGPGALVIAAGLVILARDVAWADRALRYLRRKMPGVPEDGKIPRSTMVTTGFIAVSAILVSLWFTLARG